jgi:hypothetical protein
VFVSLLSRRLYSFSLCFEAMLKFPDSNLESNHSVLSSGLFSVYVHFGISSGVNSIEDESRRSDRLYIDELKVQSFV